MNDLKKPDSHPLQGGREVLDNPYMLDVNEYLSTINIPNSQRIYTGSDSAWTRLVYRNGRSLLEQVQSFVEELRSNQGLSVPLMTPINQRVKKTDAVDPLNKSRRVRILDHPKFDENNSSINTYPVLGNEIGPQLKNANSGILTSSGERQQSKLIAPDAVIGQSGGIQEGLEINAIRTGQGLERRKSLKNPIDTEIKRKLGEMKQDIGKRKRPPVGDRTTEVDEVNPARKYLISGSSLGGPKFDSDFASFGSGDDNQMNTNRNSKLQNIDKGNKVLHGRKRQNLGPSKNTGNIEIMMLPPHLQELKEKLRQVRNMKSKGQNLVQKKNQNHT